MCFNGYCFNFDNFKSKSVVVFICGPGDLEYPWALETALRLKSAGALVTVVDLSDYSLRYSARIKVLGLRLHHNSRRFLRAIFLANQSRIENRVAAICRDNGIEWIRVLSKIRLRKIFYFGKTSLSDLKGVCWGPIEAEGIIHSNFSSTSKRSIGDHEKLEIKKVMEIKEAIFQTFEFIKSFNINKYDYFFMANGRQPVSAFLTLFLRERESRVYLYESAGGYIFPELLNRHLDYWESSPANPAELQSKIMCKKKFQYADTNLISQVSEIIKNRSLIAYSLNYLTDNPTQLQITKSIQSRQFVFFTTSEWEFSILYKSSGAKSEFTSQFDAVKGIISFLKPQDTLIIRLHPNDPNNPAPADKRWEPFANYKNVVIIPPDSRIDSYKLAAEADANFVWTSFLGYELALRGMPVAIMGEASYAKCLANNYLVNYEGLAKFIQHPFPPNLALIDMYTNYLVQGGFEIQSSKIYPGRKIFVLDQQVDTFKKIFNQVTDKFRLKIS